MSICLPQQLQRHCRAWAVPNWGQVDVLRKMAAQPRRWAALLAVLVALPGLQVGFLIDDWAHAAAISGKLPLHPGPLQLYDFGDGDAVRMRAHQDIGYPWFAVPTLKVRFFRPMSSLLTYVDHRFLGDSPVLPHAVSILCYALVVAAVAALALRALGPGLGALAAALYALDDAHAMPALWLANRNALVAAGPVLWGLVAWLRYREDGWQPGRWWALLGFAVGLCGGETALSAMALPLSYELLGGPNAGASLRARLQAMLPVFGLVVVYAIVYKALGYGARHSGAYIDPVQDTWMYLQAAALRIPGLLGVMVANVPIEITVALPGSALWFGVFGVVGALAVVALMPATWQTLDADARRHLRWLVTGSALALVPVAATFPSGRLLTVASVGGALVLACAIGRGVPAIAHSLDQPLPRFSPMQQRIAVALALVHLAAAPLLFFGGGLGLGLAGRTLDSAAVGAGMDLAAGKTAIVPAAPDILGVYGSLWRMSRGLPAPARWRPLSLALHDTEIRVDDTHTLSLRPLGGALLATEAEQLLRSPAEMFEPGDVLPINGMTATVRAVQAQGYPTEMQFRFDLPLDDPSHVWLQWRGRQLTVLPLPPTGQWMLLKREPGLLGI